MLLIYIGKIRKFPSITINKLQARSTSCVFLGYPPHHRGYQCLDLSSNKIFIPRHVIFDETNFPFATINSPKPSQYELLDEALPIDRFSSFEWPNQMVGPIAPLSPPMAINHTPTGLLVSDLHTFSSTVSNPIASTTPQSPPLIRTHHMTTRAPHGIFKPRQPLNLSVTTTSLPIPPNQTLTDPNGKAAMNEETLMLLLKMKLGS